MGTVVLQWCTYNGAQLFFEGRLRHVMYESQDLEASMHSMLHYARHLKLKVLTLVNEGFAA